MWENELLADLESLFAGKKSIPPFGSRGGDAFSVEWQVTRVKASVPPPRLPSHALQKGSSSTAPGVPRMMTPSSTQALASPSSMIVFPMPSLVNTNAPGPTTSHAAPVPSSSLHHTSSSSNNNNNNSMESGSSLVHMEEKKPALPVSLIDLRQAITLKFTYMLDVRGGSEMEQTTVTIRPVGGNRKAKVTLSDNASSSVNSMNNNSTGSRFTADVYETHLQVWVIRACQQFGMKNLAQELGKQRFPEISMNAGAPIVHKCFRIYGPYANLSTLDCPLEFAEEVLKTLAEVESTRTGGMVVQRLSTLGEVVHVVHQPGQFKIRTKQNADQQAMMYADFKSIEGSTSRKLEPLGGGSYSTTSTRPIIPFVVVCHELIHAVHDKEDLAASLARTRAEAPMPWSNQEEELTIKGWICGPSLGNVNNNNNNNSVSSSSSSIGNVQAHPYSECHLLAELQKSIRYGHKAEGGQNELTAQEMDAIYGPGWEARFRDGK